MLNSTTKLRGKTTIKVNAMAYAHLVELMLDGTHSCQELARATGLHYVTVLDYTRAMHRAGAAHICAWEKDKRGRDLIKVYRIGRGRDAKRQKLSARERSARYREKIRHRELMEKICSAPSAVAQPALLKQDELQAA